jgi:predicted small lipoprotein YifL
MQPRNFYLVIAMLLLAACGQKGALYLPEQTRTEVPATPGADASANAEDKDKEAADKATTSAK